MVRSSPGRRQDWASAWAAPPCGGDLRSSTDSASEKFRIGRSEMLCEHAHCRSAGGGFLPRWTVRGVKRLTGDGGCSLWRVCGGSVAGLRTGSACRRDQPEWVRSCRVNAAGRGVRAGGAGCGRVGARAGGGRVRGSGPVRGEHSGRHDLRPFCAPLGGAPIGRKSRPWPPAWGTPECPERPPLPVPSRRRPAAGPGWCGPAPGAVRPVGRVRGTASVRFSCAAARLGADFLFPAGRARTAPGRTAEQDVPRRVTADRAAATRRVGGQRTCMPETVRAMTRRWISLVPSKIV